MMAVVGVCSNVSRLRKLLNYTCMVSGISIAIAFLFAAPWVFHKGFYALLFGLGGAVVGLSLYAIGLFGEYLK